MAINSPPLPPIVASKVKRTREAEAAFTVSRLNDNTHAVDATDSATNTAPAVANVATLYRRTDALEQLTAAVRTLAPASAAENSSALPMRSAGNFSSAALIAAATWSGTDFRS